MSHTNFNNDLAKNIKCPYYKTSDPVRIKCEGILPNTTIMINFGNRTDKQRYTSKYCIRDMNKCEVCKILNKKYGVDYV